MKKSVAILLIIALASSSMQRYFIYAGFELNRNYIAKNLCINRNKPWMHCNGQCYFMRKMHQAEENERKQDRENQKNLFQPAMMKSTFIVRFKGTVTKITCLACPSKATSGPAFSIFQPPKFAVQQA